MAGRNPAQWGGEPSLFLAFTLVSLAMIPALIIRYLLLRRSLSGGIAFLWSLGIWFATVVLLQAIASDLQFLAQGSLLRVGIAAVTAGFTFSICSTGFRPPWIRRIPSQENQKPEHVSRAAENAKKRTVGNTERRAMDVCCEYCGSIINAGATSCESCTAPFGNSSISSAISSSGKSLEIRIDTVADAGRALHESPNRELQPLMGADGRESKHLQQPHDRDRGVIDRSNPRKLLPSPTFIILSLVALFVGYFFTAVLPPSPLKEPLLSRQETRQKGRTALVPQADSPNENSRSQSADPAQQAKDTLLRLSYLQTVMESMFVDENSYPEVSSMQDLAKLAEPVYMKQLPRNDGWGREFSIASSPQRYRIFSKGPDGMLGTPDDYVLEAGEVSAGSVVSTKATPTERDANRLATGDSSAEKRESRLISGSEYRESNRRKSSVTPKQTVVPPPPVTKRPRIVRLADGLVFSPDIGLVWQSRVSRRYDYSVTEEQAERYCSQFRVKDKSNWRLPTATELSAIIAADDQFAMNNRGQTLWTSDPEDANSKTLAPPTEDLVRPSTSQIALVTCVHDERP